MTLISIIYGNKYPVIVSDRAISDFSVTNKVKLPSTGTGTQEETHVVEFRVKSVIIKDILCITFAGIEYEILNLYDNILDFFLYRDINEPNLRLLLNEMEQNFNLSVMFALGGAEFEHNKIMVMCSGRWEQNDSKEKLNILAAGSGAKEWISHFVEHQPYLRESGDALTDCIHRAVIGTMRYMANEMYSDQFLKDGWGGGFDIIFYADGKFQRRDEITYAFLYAKEESVDQIQLINVNHNTYFDDGVLIFNMNKLNGENMEATFVPQLRRKVPSSVLDITLAFQSQEVITCVYIKKVDGTSDTLLIAMKDWEPATGPLFIAAQGEDLLRFLFKPQYIETVRIALESYLS